MSGEGPTRSEVVEECANRWRRSGGLGPVIAVAPPPPVSLLIDRYRDEASVTPFGEPQEEEGDDTEDSPSTNEGT